MSDLEEVKKHLNDVIREDIEYVEKVRLSYVALEDVAYELERLESGKNFFERFNEVLLFPYNNLNNGHREGVGYIRNNEGRIKIFVGKALKESIANDSKDFFQKYNQKTLASRERQVKLELLN